MNGSVTAVRVEVKRGVVHLRAMSTNARGTTYSLRGIEVGPLRQERADLRSQIVIAVSQLPASSA